MKKLRAPYADPAREKLEVAAAKYRRTYNRLYVASMKANSREESEQIDAKLAEANRIYAAAKEAYGS